MGKLTTRQLASAKPGKWISDGPVGASRGSGTLLFRRTPAGATLAYFRYTRPDGTRDTIALEFDGTLADARIRAREKSELLREGVHDIREHLQAQQDAAETEKRQIEAAEAAAAAEVERQARYTLRALCDAYANHLEDNAKAKSADAARSAFKCHVVEAHPDVAALSARDVTAHQVAAMVRKVREAGKERTAGVLRSYLSAAYNCALRAPFDSAMPADLIAFGIEHNPVDAIPAIPVQAGDRTLNASELRAYMGHLLRVGQADAFGPELPDMALLLALLAGGQRMAQLLRATVADWDPDTQTLRLWDGKGKRQRPREHLLPLARKATALVAGLVERAKAKESKLLFSTHGRVPMTETTPGKRVAEIAAGMGGDPFDLRDVRRTVETMLAGMRITKDVRSQVLSHGIGGVQDRHYDRYAYTDEKRTALVAWEARLDAIRNTERTPSNVVPMRAA